MPKSCFDENLTTFREILELDGFLDTPVRQLGLGQRMRGELAAARLHDPPILYLDEPTIEVDVVGQARVREFLIEVNGERGVTVLLTMHDMSDVTRLCQRIMVIDRGRLLYDGGLAAIRDRFCAERTLVVDLESGEETDGPPTPPGADEVRSDGPRRWLRFRRDETTAAQLISAVTERYRIHDLTLEKPEIEGIAT